MFRACKNLDELKKAYRAAAMKNHPDMGGTTEKMQEVNRLYEIRFEELKREQNRRAAEDTTGKTKTTTEAPHDFINIIEALLKLDGLIVELCGRWLWIGGDTKRHKEALKAAGCKWSAKKMLWSWHYAEDSDVWSKGRRSMQEIRARYGSTVYKNGEEYAALTA